MRQDLEADNTASFYFVDALFPSVPSSESEYQCTPPNLQFFDFDSIPIDQGLSYIAKKLAFTVDDSPEDAMRKMATMCRQKNPDAVALTLDYVRNIIEEDGPFDGVIGGSEGAGAAATVLVDCLRMSEKAGTPSAMKCGIFFVGAPPLEPNRPGWLLSDETDERITVATCHVLSEQDPLILPARALYNLCEPSVRRQILHERGHIIPHDRELMTKVAKFVRDLDQGLI